MALLNIPSYKDDDPRYRYKMPALVSQAQGSGNGKKTSILNIGDVAQALKRPPAYVTKFFGYELGTRSSYTEKKKGEDERATLYGWWETSALQELLDLFIEKYVLCPRCRLPEIDLVVKPKRAQDLKATCRACGWHGHLDIEHKIGCYILKNPPPQVDGVGFEGGKAEKLSREERQRTRALRKQQGEVAEEAAEGGEGFATSTIKAEKENRPAQMEKQISEKNAKRDGKTNPTKDGSSMKKKLSCTMMAPATAERKHGLKEEQDKEVPEQGERLACEEAELQKLIQQLVTFKEERASSSEPHCLLEANFFEEVRMQQIARGFSHPIRLYVVLEVLFPKGSLNPKGVEQNVGLLKRLVSSGSMVFRDWIWAFDAYVGRNEAAGKRFAMVVKALYDADLAEEEEILAHYKAEKQTPGFGITCKAVAPLVKWLETTDDDDDDDDADDNDDGGGTN